MADPQNGAAPDPAQLAAQPKLNIAGQFIRDISFENILSQKPVQGDVKPEVQVQVGTDARKRGDSGQYEIQLKITVTSKNRGSDDVLFVLELDYGGVVTVENVTEEQMHPFLLIEGPRMLFPFARRIISDMTRDGGFMPLNLDNVDFMSLYRQKMIQAAAAQASEAPKSDA